MNRRWFWDVRDWMVESSYDFYDPIREKALRTIRETERSEERVINDRDKKELIKVARLSAGPQDKQLRLRKFERITGAWLRKKEADAKGEAYDPLKDEELFLQQRDFDMYYQDLAALSRNEKDHSKVKQFPFYEQAREAIPNESDWLAQSDNEWDDEFDEAMEEILLSLIPNELEQVMNGVKESFVNPYSNIGRNDPCPCGSGKKYKKCCGRNR